MMILLIKSLVAYMYDSMAHEFDELALDGHNYLTWALDVKISLAFREIMTALTPPIERERDTISGYIQVPDTIHHPEPPPPRLKVGICDGGGAS
jgi:hypothetical protein